MPPSRQTRGRLAAPSRRQARNGIDKRAGVGDCIPQAASRRQVDWPGPRATIGRALAPMAYQRASSLPAPPALGRPRAQRDVYHRRQRAGRCDRRQCHRRARRGAPRRRAPRLCRCCSTASRSMPTAAGRPAAERYAAQRSDQRLRGRERAQLGRALSRQLHVSISAPTRCASCCTRRSIPYCETPSKPLVVLAVRGRRRRRAAVGGSQPVARRVGRASAARRPRAARHALRRSRGRAGDRRRRGAWTAIRRGSRRCRSAMAAPTCSSPTATLNAGRRAAHARGENARAIATASDLPPQSWTSTSTAAPDAERRRSARRCVADTAAAGRAGLETGEYPRLQPHRDDHGARADGRPAALRRRARPAGAASRHPA